MSDSRYAAEKSASHVVNGGGIGERSEALVAVAEKRQYPRFEYSGRIKINNRFIGDIKNLSENGINFIIRDALLEHMTTVSFQLSNGSEVKGEIEVRRVVEKPDPDEKEIGAKFIKLLQDAVLEIRSEFVQSKIGSLLDEIGEGVLQSKVKEFFLGDVARHISEVIELTKFISVAETVDRDTVYEKFSASVDQVLTAGRALEPCVEKKILLDKLKAAFRAIINHWIYRGEIVRRAFTKPRGYPGDYLTIEKIYANRSESVAMGYYSDRYFLNNEYAVAVRGRRKKIRPLLREAFENSKKKEINILNLACGSSRELIDLLEDNDFPDKVLNLTLIDQDQEALDYSKEHLPNLSNLSIALVSENVFELFKSDRSRNKLNGQDFIYSIGLADYLPERILKKTVEFLSAILNRDGTFILTHKDIACCNPVAPDWFCKWRFYPRTEKEIVTVVKSSLCNDVEIADVQREESGRIVFVIARK